MHVPATRTHARSCSAADPGVQRAARSPVTWRHPYGATRRTPQTPGGRACSPPALSRPEQRSVRSRASETCRCRQRAGEHTAGVAAASARGPVHARGARHNRAMGERRYSWLEPEDRDEDSRSPRRAPTQGPGAGAPERRMLRPPPLHPTAVKGRSNSDPPIGVTSKCRGSHTQRHPTWRPPPLVERPGEPGATGGRNDARSADAADQPDCLRLPQARRQAHPAAGDPQHRRAHTSRRVTQNPEELAQVILGRPVVVSAPRKTARDSGAAWVPPAAQLGGSASDTVPATSPTLANHPPLAADAPSDDRRLLGGPPPASGP